MNLLITGTTGFLGSRIATYYSDKYTVLALSHSDLDITDLAQVSDTFHAFSPDIVIHCAAISDVGACAKNPELSMAVNVEGTLNLARASAKVDARFIFCSSDQVYFYTPPVTTLSPHTEDEPLDPLPLYGQHKLLAEQVCLEEQPDSVILRLSWMYDRLTSEESVKGKRNFLTMFEDALRTGTPLPSHRQITKVSQTQRMSSLSWKKSGRFLPVSITMAVPITLICRKPPARSCRHLENQSFCRRLKADGFVIYL